MSKKKNKTSIFDSIGTALLIGVLTTGVLTPWFALVEIHKINLLLRLMEAEIKGIDSDIYELKKQKAWETFNSNQRENDKL